MEIPKLIECSQVLAQLSEGFSALPEAQQKGIQAAICLQIANLYIVELAKHLTDGKDPYDAMLATAKGELPLPMDSDPAVTVMRLLGAKPKE